MDIANKLIKQEAVRQDPRLAGQDEHNNSMDYEGGFRAVYQHEAGQKTKAPDIKIGDSIIIMKRGAKRRIPASRKSDAEALGWTVETKEENGTKPAPSKK
jgi:hypothetical protein